MADKLIKDDEADHSWELPPTISIPCPVPLARRTGIRAKKEDQHPLALRITEHDKAIVQEEARELGVSVNGFIRWCAVQTARELCRIRTGKKMRVDL